MAECGDGLTLFDDFFAYGTDYVAGITGLGAGRIFRVYDLGLMAECGNDFLNVFIAYAAAANAASVLGAGGRLKNDPCLDAVLGFGDIAGNSLVADGAFFVAGFNADFAAGRLFGDCPFCVLRNLVAKRGDDLALFDNKSVAVFIFADRADYIAGIAVFSAGSMLFAYAIVSGSVAECGDDLVLMHTAYGAGTDETSVFGAGRIL